MKRVIIYSHRDRAPTACWGEGRFGRCPKVPPGKPVFCAGYRIRVVDERGRVERDIAVPAGATWCPLAVASATSQ